MKVARTVARRAVALAPCCRWRSRSPLRRRRPGRGQAAATPVAKLVAEPASLTLRTGESVALKVTAYDAAGKPIPDAVVRVNLPRGAGHRTPTAR